MSCSKLVLTDDDRSPDTLPRKRCAIKPLSGKSGKSAHWSVHNYAVTLQFCEGKKTLKAPKSVTPAEESCPWRCWLQVDKLLCCLQPWKTWLELQFIFIFFLIYITNIEAMDIGCQHNFSWIKATVSDSLPWKTQNTTVASWEKRQNGNKGRVWSNFIPSVLRAFRTSHTGLYGSTSLSITTTATLKSVRCI